MRTMASMFGRTRHFMPLLLVVVALLLVEVIPGGSVSHATQSTTIFEDCFDEDITVIPPDVACSDDTDVLNTLGLATPPWAEVGGTGAGDCRIEDEELTVQDGCTATQADIVTAGLSNIHLEYLWGYNTLNGQDPDGDIVVEWSPDNGTTWLTVQNAPLPKDGSTCGISPEECADTAEDFSLDLLAENACGATIAIRFTGTLGDADDNADKVAIDDVIVSGESDDGGDCVESSASECADGVDNDGDGNVDLVDSGCAPFIPTVEPTMEPTATPEPFVPDPDPKQFPQLGGTPVPPPTATLTPEPVETPEPDSGVGAISPPSTGSAGLLP